MGADMIVNFLTVRAGTPLDWSKLEPALAALTQDEIEKGLDDGGYWEEASPEEDRAQVVKVFEQLRAIFVDGAYDREIASFVIQDTLVYLTGGLSWGDAPTEVSDIISQAWGFPSVLTAIGFEA